MQARSGADERLAAVLSESGQRVSAWQVERWRQSGLIPPAKRRSLGRGAGSISEYSPEAVEQARAVAAAVRHRRPLSEVALTLFMRGYPIEERVLKAAFAAWLSKIERWLGSADSSDERFDIAERRAVELARYSKKTRQGRRIIRRARRLKEDPEAVAVSAYTNMLLLLQGEQPPEDAIAELLDVGGLGAAFQDKAAGVGPLAPGLDDTILNLIRKVNFPTLRQTIEASTLADLAWARDILLVVAPFARAIAVLARTLFKLPDAFGFAVIGEVAADELLLAHGMPILLLGRELFETEGARELLSKMQEQLSYFSSAAAFLESLPPQIRRRLPSADPGLLDRLPAEEAARVRDAAAALRIDGESRGYGRSN